MVIYVRMKWVLLNTELTTVITVLNTVNSSNLTTKFMLIVSHFIFITGNKYNLLKDKYCAGLVLLWLKDLRANQWIEHCIRVNTRELNRELCTGLSTLYAKSSWSMLLPLEPTLITMYLS